MLADSPQCQECIDQQQYFRYVSGRLETPADQPLIRGVFEEFKKTGFQFQDMMVADDGRDVARR